MNKIKPMAADDQAVLRMSLEGEIGTTMFSIKENKDSVRCNLTWHYDFTGVTRDELKLEVMRAWKIDDATKWREAKDRMDADKWQGRMHSGRDRLDNVRQKKTDVAKAETAMDKLTKAERDVLIAKWS